MRQFFKIFFFVLAAFMALLLQWQKIYAQDLSRSFTITDGLPSNLIYSFVQDDNGFLWIATDNGIARFDGKYFRNYTVKDGLPDNEVLEVFKENDGTIWVNTFKQGPCYFDEKANRFVDPLKGLNINREFIKMVLHARTLDEGGVIFYAPESELVFIRRKLVKFPYPKAFSFMENNEPVFLHADQLKQGNKFNTTVIYKKGHKVDSVLLFSKDLHEDSHIVQFINDRFLYVLSRKGKFYKIGYDENTQKFEIKMVYIDDELLWVRFTKKRITITTRLGHIYVFDKKNMDLHYTIEENYIANCLLEDNDKNIWVGSMDKGMKLYKINHIELLPLGDEKLQPNFLSISTGDPGKIFGGSYFGEIYETVANHSKIYAPLGHQSIMWIRKLIYSQGKVFSFSEQGVFVNHNRKVFFENSPLGRIKSATLLNDSVIIATGVSSDGGLYKLNTINDKAFRLPCNLVRISSVATLGNRYIYCGTNEGLYKYDYAAQKLQNVFKNTPLEGQRILALTSTSDGLLIAATAIDGLFVVKDDKIIKSVGASFLTNTGVVSMMATPQKSIWVGTRNGLSKISYSLSNNEFNYTINNFSQTEGLPANIINDISYRNDTVFLATEKGVAFLPENLTSHNEEIKTILTSLKVNLQEWPLTPDNRYNLNYSQRWVMLEFSGIDLGGHLKKIQYTLDSTKGWSDLDSDDLSLELNTGKHALLVRSMDINGNAKNPVLAIFFIINTPYYLKVWFIMLIGSVLTALLAIFYHKYQMSSEKRIWEQQKKIEEERSRITADLHDEIGSTLSSLQIYSDVAYDLIDKNKEDTKDLLKQITSKASKISENIADIIWSMKTNDQYGMGPETRIKNIISEMLGPTEINYEIIIDNRVDGAIKCIICRKNLILLVKEAINNVVKYSQATKVSVSLHFERQDYILQIKDNGIGMNIEACLSKGNGLGNMKKRTEEIGGEFTIISAPEQGTEIRCKIPVTNYSGA